MFHINSCQGGGPLDPLRKGGEGQHGEPTARRAGAPRANGRRAHVFSARNAVRPVCKPVQAESEIASAERRVKALCASCASLRPYG